MSATTAVSAPGKVLLAGGYLVLERDYSGVVFGLSARINAITSTLTKSSESTSQKEIVVESPQFKDAIWRFQFASVNEDGGIKVTQIADPRAGMSRNSFIETALTYALTYIASSTTADLPLATTTKILADNDYYSTQSLSSDAITNGFANFGVPITEANKTGLGSSAALVTSLTGSLLAHFLKLPLQEASARRTLHNLAQAAHCAAQGKIGSGFDVAAAVYGSCKYRRFSPETLSSFPEPGTPGFGSALKAKVDSQWDVEIDADAVALPAGVALRMFDVACGTQTVSMVKGVLAWRKQDPEGSRKLWDELHSRNEELAAKLMASQKSEIPEAVEQVRSIIRDMTKLTGMPVEPESQTKLLNAVSQVEGVYGGVVPGAGGFDAISVLVEESAVKSLEAFEKEWNLKEQTKTRLLRVQGEMEGVKFEDAVLFKEW